MDILTPIAFFLSPYLVKAGEKISEKTVETLFESRHDIADKFKNLFHDEIITLNLNESSTVEETARLIEGNPEVQEAIRQKVEANQDLMDALTKALSKQEGRTITCKTYIENASNFVINQ